MGGSLLGGNVMEIDVIFTIVVGVAALISPIIVAIQTSKQTKKELIIKSRFDWLKSTKKILDDYIKKLHEYSISEQVDLNLINESIELKTKLELQFKPYEIRAKNIEINDNITDSDNFKNIKKFIDETYKDTRIIKNDDLEALLLDFLNFSQIILEESYKNKAIYKEEINFLINEIVLLQIGIQKNEWDRINLIEKSFFNNFFEEVKNSYKKLLNQKVRNYTEVTLNNVNHVIEIYIEKSNHNHDTENLKATKIKSESPDYSQKKVLSKDGFDFTFIKGVDTVPKYMNRKLEEMKDNDFEFKELYGKRGHKYLVKSTTEDASTGFARFRDFTDKNGDKWFYDVNLTPEESEVVIQNIFEKNEVLINK